MKSLLMKKPRNATAQFVRRLNWFVGLYQKKDQRLYVHEHVLVKLGIMEAVKTGKITAVIIDALKAYGAQPAPPICC